MNSLIGLKFGNWEVLDRSENRLIGKDKKSERYWRCICNCGFCDGIIKDVNEKNLKNGRSSGCGKESKLKKGKNRKYNIYNLEGNYGMGYTSKGEEFYFDLEDYDKIKQYFWIVHDDGTNKYVRAYKETINTKHIYIFMHNLVMNNDLNNGTVVDHIFGDTLDNRKMSLRICKRIENVKNSKMFRNNTSGYKGVSYSKLQNQWVAYITCNNKKIHLGTFDNLNDAIEVRKKAEINYFGKFNRDNRGVANG